MKHKLKVSSGFSGVIATGSFQNSRPSFNAEVEFEVDTKEEVSLAVEVMQEELYRICRDKFDNVAEQEKIVKIKNDRKDFRWYKLADGREVPSVTSILGFDSDIPEDELKQYAAQSVINHSRVADFITTGVWKKPQELEGLTAEKYILKTGLLQLDPDACDFPSFLKKYPISDLKNGEVVINEKHEYGGLPDGTGVFNGLKTLFDIKRTPDKTKNFLQMAAYAKCLDGIQQLMIIPLNDSTEQKFSKPIVTQEVDKYFDLFVYRRAEFRKVYGV